MLVFSEPLPFRDTDKHLQVKWYHGCCLFQKNSGREKQVGAEVEQDVPGVVIGAVRIGPWRSILSHLTFVYVFKSSS